MSCTCISLHIRRNVWCLIMFSSKFNLLLFFTNFSLFVFTKFLLTEKCIFSWQLAVHGFFYKQLQLLRVETQKRPKTKQLVLHVLLRLKQMKLKLMKTLSQLINTKRTDRTQAHIEKKNH